METITYAGGNWRCVLKLTCFDLVHSFGGYYAFFGIIEILALRTFTGMKSRVHGDDNLLT